MVGNDVGSGAHGGIASADFVQRMQGYGLTTAEILYRRPDRKWLLQSYVWQSYDLFPKFPKLQEFLVLLAGETRRAAVLGDGRAFAPDQADGF